MKAASIRVHELMSEYVELFRIIHPQADLRKTLWRLNNGLCYTVAGVVGQVLRNEGYKVEFHTHCHHAWIRVNGFDYDTLYPTGYPRAVKVEWLFEEMGFNLREDTDNESDWNPNDSVCDSGVFSVALVNKVWCEKHDIEFPNDRQRIITRANGKRENKRFFRRYQKALSHTFSGDLLQPGQLFPFTHYLLDCIEDDKTRPLKPIPFSRDWKTMKFLFKDFRVRGIPINQM